MIHHILRLCMRVFVCVCLCFPPKQCTGHTPKRGLCIYARDNICEHTCTTIGNDATTFCTPAKTM